MLLTAGNMSSGKGVSVGTQWGVFCCARQQTVFSCFLFVSLS